VEVLIMARTQSASAPAQPPAPSTETILARKAIDELREEFKEIRRQGPIPALMAEYQTGAPPDETVAVEDFTGPAYLESGYARPDGSDMTRRVWVDEEWLVHPWRYRLQEAIERAGEIAMPFIRDAGHDIAMSTTCRRAAWLWGLFELAECGPLDPRLRLKHGRRFPMPRPAAAKRPRKARKVTREEFAIAIEAANSPTIYWRIDDIVSASMAALEIAHEQTMELRWARLEQEARENWFTEWETLKWLRDCEAFSADKRIPRKAAEAKFGIKSDGVKSRFDGLREFEGEFGIQPLTASVRKGVDSGDYLTREGRKFARWIG
jgi:hypothetical protein